MKTEYCNSNFEYFHRSPNYHHLYMIICEFWIGKKRQSTFEYELRNVFECWILFDGQTRALHDMNNLFIIIQSIMMNSLVIRKIVISIFLILFLSMFVYLIVV